MSAVAMVVAVTVGCLFLHPGVTQVAISDFTAALLMLSALLAFVRLGWESKGRIRWFWILQAAGWALWLADQVVWIISDLYLQKKWPAMSPADALLFLAGAPMMAGLLLRPHRQPAERSARLGVLDFSLLALFWVYLYISFVVCWQYISPNEPGYSRNFDLLSSAQNILLALIVAAFVRETSGAWKKFYIGFCGAVIFNAIAFYVLNRALETGSYYTGSWYDIPYNSSFAVFTMVALLGRGLTTNDERISESYSSWMANLALIAVLSLPVLAIYALVDPALPLAASHFRVLVGLSTMFLMAFILFIQHRRLNRELLRTNVVLQEASLTDPLTGLRNRRYFSATIDGDVSQSLRSHTDGRDMHTSDLVFYLIDADHFKEVNDQYGHDVGDRVLVELARRLSSSVRHSDVLVRWGGEEFLIVSRYTNRAEAELLAQRVLSAVADVPFDVGAGEKIFRTCSLGWAAFPWYPDRPRAVRYEEVLTLADRALNRAKQSGRNCAVGMLPATGKLPATTVAGLHSSPLEVDLLAVTGPHHDA